jgi:deoxycytidine triphosphate deaminase
MRSWLRRKSAASPSSTPLAAQKPEQRIDLAASVDEARRRFGLYKTDDPFPEIPPALMNSADIADYVAATGMIYPFTPDGLKSASYEVSLLGEVVYWDEDGRHEQDVRRGDTFILRRNSIAFVTMEPEFHLPDYIALRFNLKIPNVYKGLLLGTGPLVDPGWEGQLSIPLHNLTTNNYPLKGGDPLIWMEFTKLSPNTRWTKRRRNALDRRGDYVPFPETKKFGNVRTRLEVAAPNMPVSSSLAEAFANAKDAVGTARSLSTRIQFGGAIALIFGLATIVGLAVDIIFFERGSTQPGKTSSIVVVERAEMRSLQRQVRQLRVRLAAIERQRAGQR